MTGFKSNAITDEILHFIAGTSAKEGGDARLSLKILSRAGELAEEKEIDKISMKEAERRKTCRQRYRIRTNRDASRTSQTCTLFNCNTYAKRRLLQETNRWS